MSDSYYFQLPPYRSITIQAARKNDQDATVQILLGDRVLREFDWPAYKVWNVAAHSTDIIDDILDRQGEDALWEAGSDLLGGNAYRGSAS